jgi:NACalpha-BTF3-like transcription factor
LAAVEIKDEDVDLIVNELEVTKQVAERKLREHKGDLQATLNYFINA